MLVSEAVNLKKYQNILSSVYLKLRPLQLLISIQIVNVCINIIFYTIANVCINTVLQVYFRGENFREFRGSISERENIIHDYNY